MMMMMMMACRVMIVVILYIPVHEDSICRNSSSDSNESEKSSNTRNLRIVGFITVKQLEQQFIRKGSQSEER